jgi:hypothetical protein
MHNPYSSFITPAFDYGETWEGWILITPKELDTEAKYPSPQALLISREITSGDEKLYFPVHQPCLELFGLHMKGRQTSHRDFLGLDRDALWRAFYLFMERHRAELIAPYGLAYRCQRDVWWSRRGLEFLVANPKLDWPATGSENRTSNPATSELGAFIVSQASSTGATRTFLSPETATALSAKVKTDALGNLPLELLLEMTNHLDDGSLFALCSASWTIYSALRTDTLFWRQRIRRVSMPWLVELFPLLDDADLMKGVDTKALLCGLDRLTQPREGMRGALMGVANRRRIWENCEELGTVYAEAVVALPDLLESKRTLSDTVHAYKEEDFWYPAAVEGDKGEDAAV